MFRRFRFSLKWMLIGFTVLSVGFYLFFVSPTVTAKRLIASCKEGKYVTLPAHFVDDGDELRKHKWSFNDARLEPLDWTDIRKSQRRIVLKMSSDTPGLSVEIRIKAMPMNCTEYHYHYREHFL